MKLKKSRLLAEFIFITFLLYLQGMPSLFASGNSDVLPILHYAGVIPVQWENAASWSDLDRVKKTSNKDFSDAVKASNRFTTLNDDLVKSLWSTPAGRAELAKDYELQSFATLNMSARGDMVVMTTRLLSPKLETYLQESDVVSRQWLINGSHDDVVKRMTDLVQRMINRLPIDAHITSVNNEFVTVSAGTYQGLSVGDEFDVIDPKIESLHPANGSWLTYTTGRSGRIKIVEAKGRSSIGKVISLTHDASIKQNHGILIESISGRKRFVRPEKEDTFVGANTDDSDPIVPPMRPDGSAMAKKESAKLESPKEDAAPAKPGKVVAVFPASPEKKPGTEKQGEQLATDAEKSDCQENCDEKSPDSNGPSPTDTILATIAPPGTDLEMYAGLRSWSIGGSASAKSALPLWLLNSFGAQVRRPFSESIELRYGLDLAYGSTGNKGNAFGYGLNLEGLYLHKTKPIEAADRIFGGIQAEIKSMSIGGESSGGYNLTTLSLVLGMGGLTNSSMLGMKLDWIADLHYALQESGQFGVSGKRETVKSGDSMLLRFLGYGGERKKDQIQYGGGFEFGTANYHLSNSTSATHNVISILGLGRMSM
jgi:hypothetical protein